MTEPSFKLKIIKNSSQRQAILFSYQRRIISIDSLTNFMRGTEHCIVTKVKAKVLEKNRTSALKKILTLEKRINKMGVIYGYVFTGGRITCKLLD
jgi:predicted metal-binding protein